MGRRHRPPRVARRCRAAQCGPYRVPAQLQAPADRLEEFSPDGRSILYTTNHQAGRTDVWTQIETVPVDDPSAVLRIIRPASAGGSQASYSPDGSRIVHNCGWALCTMAAHGSDVREIMSVAGIVPVQPSRGITPTP